MNPQLYTQMLNDQKRNIAGRAAAMQSRSPVSNQIGNEDYATESARNVRYNFNKLIPGGAFGQIAAMLIPTLVGVVNANLKASSKIIGETLTNTLSGPLGAVVQAVRPSTAARIEESKAMRAKQSQMSGLEAGLISGGAGLGNLRRLIYGANLIKVLGTGMGGGIGSMFGPLGLGMAGVSLAGGLMRSRVNARINAQRGNLTAIERRNSLSSGLINQVTSLASRGQIQPGDQLQIHILAQIEAHTSVLSLIFDEMDFLRQEKEKGTESANSSVNELMSGPGSNVNPLVRLINTFEDTVNRTLLKYDPITQTMNLLFGGKSPKRALDELAGYGMESYGEKRALRKEAQARGISIQDHRLMNSDITSLMSGSYEEKMYTLGIIQSKFLKIIASENISMRQNMGIENSYKQEDQSRGLFGDVFKGITDSITNLPIINAGINLTKFATTYAQRTWDAVGNIGSWMKRGMFGSEFMNLQNPEEMEKRIGAYKSLDQQYKEYISSGLPDKIEQQTVHLATLAELTRIQVENSANYYTLDIMAATGKNVSSIFRTGKDVQINRQVWSFVDAGYKEKDEMDKLIDNRTRIREQERTGAFMRSPVGRILWAFDKLVGNNRTEEDRMYKAIDIGDKYLTRATDDPFIHERMGEKVGDFAAQTERNRATPSGRAWNLQSSSQMREYREQFETVGGKFEREKRGILSSISGFLGGLAMSTVLGPMGFFLGMGGGLGSFQSKDEQILGKILNKAELEHGKHAFGRLSDSVISVLNKRDSERNKFAATVGDSISHSLIGQDSPMGQLTHPLVSIRDTLTAELTTLNASTTDIVKVLNSIAKWPNNDDEVLTITPLPSTQYTAASGGKFKIPGRGQPSKKILVGEVGPETLDVHSGGVDIIPNYKGRHHGAAASGMQLRSQFHGKQNMTGSAGDARSVGSRTRPAMMALQAMAILGTLGFIGPLAGPIVGPIMAMLAPSLLGTLGIGAGIYAGGVLGERSDKKELKYLKAQKELFEEAEKRKKAADPSYIVQKWTRDKTSGIGGFKLGLGGMIGGAVGGAVGGVPGAMIGAAIPAIYSWMKLRKATGKMQSIDDARKKREIEKINKLKTSDITKLTPEELRLIIADEDYSLWKGEQEGKQGPGLFSKLLSGIGLGGLGSLLTSGVGGLLGLAGSGLGGLSGIAGGVGLTGIAGTLGTVGSVASAGSGLAATVLGLGSIFGTGMAPVLLPLLGLWLGSKLPGMLHRRKMKKEDQTYKARLIQKLMYGHDVSDRFGGEFMHGEGPDNTFSKDQLAKMYEHVQKKDQDVKLGYLTAYAKGDKAGMGKHNGLLPILAAMGLDISKYKDDTDAMNHIMHAADYDLDPQTKLAKDTLLKAAQARAKGGRVKKDNLYVVGEKRPEIFKPDTHGQINAGTIFEKMSEQLAEIKDILEEIRDKQFGGGVLRDIYKDMKSVTVGIFNIGSKLGSGIWGFIKSTLSKVKTFSMFSTPIKFPDLKKLFEKFKFPKIAFSLPEGFGDKLKEFFKGGLKTSWSIFKFPFKLGGNIIGGFFNALTSLFSGTKSPFKLTWGKYEKFRLKQMKITAKLELKKAKLEAKLERAKLKAGRPSILSSWADAWGKRGDARVKIREEREKQKTERTKLRMDVLSKIYEDMKSVVTLKGLRRKISSFFGKRDPEEEIQRRDFSDTPSFQSEAIYWLQRIHMRLDRIPKRGIMRKVGGAIGGLAMAPFNMAAGFAGAVGGFGGGMKEQLADIKMANDKEKWEYYRDVATEFYEMQLGDQKKAKSPKPVSTLNKKKDEGGGGILDFLTSPLMMGLLAGGLAALTSGKIGGIGLAGIVGKALGVVFKAVGEILENSIKTGSKFMDNLVKAIPENSIIKTLTEKTGTMWKTVKELPGKIFGGIGEWIGKKFSGITDGIMKFINGPAAFMGADELSGVVGKAGAEMGEAGAQAGGKGIFSLLKSGAEKAFTSSLGFGKTLLMGGAKALKLIGKAIPFLGVGIGAYFAWGKFKEGDYFGGMLELGSGLASLVPGIGTAVSIGLDIWSAFRDMTMTKEERANDSAQWVQKMQDYMTSMWDKLTEWAIDKAKGIIETVTFGIIDLDTKEDKKIAEKLKQQEDKITKSAEDKIYARMQQSGQTSKEDERKQINTRLDELANEIKERNKQLEMLSGEDRNTELQKIGKLQSEQAALQNKKGADWWNPLTWGSGEGGIDTPTPPNTYGGNSGNMKDWKATYSQKFGISNQDQSVINSYTGNNPIPSSVNQPSNAPQPQSTQKAQQILTNNPLPVDLKRMEHGYNQQTAPREVTNEGQYSIDYDHGFKPGQDISGGKSFARPTTGQLKSAFGPRIHPIRKVRSNHAGWDLANKQGTPIYASKDGRVTHSGVGKSGIRGGYGNYIDIDHGDGTMTRYGHLATLQTKPGEMVKKGQQIGLMGSTGASTGSHLHFEIRNNGAPVDPAFHLGPYPTNTLPPSVQNYAGESGIVDQGINYIKDTGIGRSLSGGIVGSLAGKILGSLLGSVLGSESVAKLGQVAGGLFGSLGAAASTPDMFTPSGTSSFNSTIGNVDIKNASADVQKAIEEASRQTGVDKNLLYAIARAESGLNPSVRSGTSSATGLFQITDGTWKGLTNQYGRRYGINPSTDRRNPQANALMGAEYIRQIHRSLGRTDPASTYMGLFLGEGGAKSFFNGLAQNPNMPAEQFFNQTDTGRKALSANRSIFSGRSLQQVYTLMAGKIGATPVTQVAQASTNEIDPNSLKVMDTGGFFTGRQRSQVGIAQNNAIREAMFTTRNGDAGFIPHQRGHAPSMSFMRDLADELLEQLGVVYERKQRSQSVKVDPKKSQPIIYVDNKTTKKDAGSSRASEMKQRESSSVPLGDLDTIIHNIFKSSAYAFERAALNHPFGSTMGQNFVGSTAV